ncbi:MAG TPA: response regulator [Fimbriimonadaceae bacterium]|jgi:CheY-like chemotaxis protein
MSYPSDLSVLIVEDEAQVKEYYEELFRAREDCQVGSVDCAFSYEDGLYYLQSEKIYHLVIIDLRIPERAQEPPPTHIDFGLRLVDYACLREHCPIPAVLVISGHMDAASQHQLEGLLEEQVYYGKARVKNNLEQDIASAVLAIKSYSNVGLKVGGSDGLTYPSLTPREEELLRRAVVANGCIGLDLRFWSAEENPSSPAAEFNGWTKAFFGRLIEANYEFSGYCFFKLAPRAERKIAERDATTLSRSLKHVPVEYVGNGGDRFLLVTRSASLSQEPPVSLSSYLSRPNSEIERFLPGIASDISQQLSLLGERKFDLVTGISLLPMTFMQVNGAPAIYEVENQFRGLILKSEEAVAVVKQAVSKIESEGELIRISKRIGHGDLNPSNVALDVADDVKAYIFDAANMHLQPSTRDLANLEVVTLLHTLRREDVSGALLRKLYGESSTHDFEARPLSNFEENAADLIAGIRTSALSLDDEKVYRLQLFDVAFGQVWGLSFSGSANKIKNPKDAARLLVAIAVNVLEISS